MLKRGSEATERQQGFCRKTGLQGLPTRVTLSLWAYSRQGATGVPLFTTWILWQARGEPQYLETFRAEADPGSELSHLGLAPSSPPRDRDLGRLDLGGGFWNGDYGWGSRVRRPFGARGRSSEHTVWNSAR